MECVCNVSVYHHGKLLCSTRHNNKASNAIVSHAVVQALHESRKLLHGYHIPECEIHTSQMPCIMCTAALRQADINHIIYNHHPLDISHLIFETIK
ncbi:MAG: hypothetical protein J5701_07955 [Bacteroidales bacterium]|nr:hypothetical protein [Bacteroidales bacterium]